MTIDDAKELVSTFQPLLLCEFVFRDGQAAATASLASGGVIDSIAIDDGGADYAWAPYITLLGDGIGATAEAVITDGVVTAVNVTDGGEGYSFAFVVFGDVLFLASKDVTYGGIDYQGRLSEIDLESVQAMSESGVDIAPSLTLRVADADSSIYLNWEESASRGFKGSRVTLTLVFYDVLSNSFSEDSIIRYQGIADPATVVDENWLEVRTTNRLNAGKKMLPTELIQKQCWKIRPRTARQCAEADTPGSPYYPCGITDPEAAECNYTREGCLAANNLARFSGITFAPAHDGGRGREYTSGQWVQLYNSSNDAKYGEPWPLVLGRGWVECPVLNFRQDGNYTRMDVGLTVGHIDTGQGATVAMKVIVNGYELPPAGYDSPNGFVALNPGNVGWWNWGGRGWRDGDAASATDPHGSEATIECVVPRTVAGGESVPQVSVLFTGPMPGEQFQGPRANLISRTITSITVVGTLVTVTFVGINSEIASNDLDYAFTIAGNTLGAANGDWTHLINWTWGPPGTVQFNAAIADGTGTGGTFTYSSDSGDAAVFDNPIWHLYDCLLRSGWMTDELDYASFLAAANVCSEAIEYEGQYE